MATFFSAKPCFTFPACFVARAIAYSEAGPSKLATWTHVHEWRLDVDDRYILDEIKSAMPYTHTGVSTMVTNHKNE